MDLSVVLGNVMGEVKGISCSVMDYSESVGFAWDGAVYNAIRHKASAICEDLNKAYRYIDTAQNNSVGFELFGSKRNYVGNPTRQVSFGGVCPAYTGNEWIHVSEDAATSANSKAHGQLLPQFDTVIAELRDAKNIRTKTEEAYNKLNASPLVITPKILEGRLNTISRNIDNAINAISSSKTALEGLIRNTDNAVANIISYDKNSGFYGVRDAINNAKAIPDDSKDYDAIRKAKQELENKKANSGGYQDAEMNAEINRLNDMLPILPNKYREIPGASNTYRAANGSIGSVAHRNTGGEVSCTYYTLRRLRERGLGFPFAYAGSAGGGQWYQNCTNEVPKRPGRGGIQALIDEFGLPLKNIVMDMKGHVMLIDEVTMVNGQIVVKYSDNYPKMYGNVDTSNNPQQTKTLNEFLNWYEKYNPPINGAILIGE